MLKSEEILLNEFMAKIIAKNPGEEEFHQAVREVELHNLQSKKKVRMPVDGVFVAVGGRGVAVGAGSAVGASTGAAASAGGAAAVGAWVGGVERPLTGIIGTAGACCEATAATGFW